MTKRFGQVREHKGIKISCYSAGHVLGACMFLVEINGVRVRLRVG